MKTAISLPQDTFHAVTSRAKDLGISRSEFFAVAARRYLAELDGQSMTARINEALSDIGTDATSAIAVAAGRRRSAAGDW